MTFALAGVSIPNFWLGPLLAIVFAVELGWLPVSGRGTLAPLMLPAVSLGLALAAILARMTRASLLDELRELYVRAARARGVSRVLAITMHALRNSMVPLLTIVALQFGAVLTGAVITETIFAWTGIGRLLIQSIGFRDYPMVQGCILLLAVTYATVNLVTDLMYGVLDPRRRLEWRFDSANAGACAGVHRAQGRRAPGLRLSRWCLFRPCWRRGCCRGMRQRRTCRTACRDRLGRTGSGWMNWAGTFSRASCSAPVCR